MENLEEYSQVMEYMKDDVWKNSPFGFVVSEEWWNSWIAFATDDSGKVTRPIEMRNDHYLQSYTIIVSKYKVLHPEAWRVFIESRKYRYKPELLVFFHNGLPDFNPYNFYLSWGDIEQNSCITISVKATVSAMLSYLKFKYFIDPFEEIVKINDVVVYDINSTFENLGIQKGSKVLIGNEIKKSQSQNTSRVPFKKNHNRRGGVHNFTEEEGFRSEDFIEPDPSPRTLDPSESSAREMIEKSLNSPCLTFHLLSKEEIKSNIKSMLEDLKSK
jgi:hypothetical protein